ncbi:MAG: xanthine dehydrogenase family protein molybdopterin-binding subunit [Acidobacteriota bacterium]|nr:xanthine dehydrogenase family protein molybdopterin-binding subunit [Acidobacteriota bacterium]
MAGVAETAMESVIGKPVPRVDGPLKVSGTARYTSDHNLEGMLYAVPVCATIAKGRIRSLNVAAAESVRGVKAVYHRENIGKVFRTAPAMGFSLMSDERRPPFEDDVIRYWGQYVAVVVAETFQQAQAGAAAVQVSYDAEPHDVSTELALPAGESLREESKRGDVAAAFASAPVKIDATYVTPAETHNPIELHASVAAWDGQSFTLYETSQAVWNQREVLAQMLGVPLDNVRVISRFLGSGFGGKLWPWPHSVLAAVAARKLNRPVKLVVSRRMMFQNVGHRPLTQQRVRVSAKADGTLLSLDHEALNHTAILDDFSEGCGEATGYLYSVPNVRIASALVRRNVGSATAMRGPGAVPGLYATESAMDELAVALKMDPVALRLKNEPKLDESLGLPFSSRHMVECLQVGAEKFGWARRTPQVGSMKADGKTLGWGVAVASWIAARFDCEAKVELRADGSARVACGTQDVGTGTYTVLAQVVADKAGVPLDRVEVVLGDTTLPPGPISGGSMVTSSMIPAVGDATRQAIETVLLAATSSKTGPFAGKKRGEVEFANGRVQLKGDASSGVGFGEVLAAQNLSVATGSGKSGATFGAKPTVSQHSFGAQFVEVTWQPEIARLRVSRVVTVIDAGRVLNLRAGRNQIEGAVMMGVGMAMFEQTEYDHKTGATINNSLADYLMTTHADAPSVDVTFLDYPDLTLNEYGARGIGEIGLAGVAPAITAAVYHATGVRVRRLPIRIEDLLANQKLA